MVPQLVGIAVPVVTASLSLLSEAAAPDPTRPRCDFVHADGSHCECDGVNRISSLDSDIVAALWKIKHVEDPMHTRLRPMRWVGTNTDFMTERAASDAVDKDMRFCDTHVSKEDFESFRVVRDSYAGNAVQRELYAFKEMCDEHRDAGKGDGDIDMEKDDLRPSNFKASIFEYLTDSAYLRTERGKDLIKRYLGFPNYDAARIVFEIANEVMPDECSRRSVDVPSEADRWISFCAFRIRVHKYAKFKDITLWLQLSHDKKATSFFRAWISSCAAFGDVCAFLGSREALNFCLPERFRDHPIGAHVRNCHAHQSPRCSLTVQSIDSCFVHCCT